MTQNARQARENAARGKKTARPTPHPCPCGCGTLVDPGARRRRYVDPFHKRRYERLARQPKAPRGMGRDRGPRLEIGEERCWALARIASRLGLGSSEEISNDDLRQALDWTVNRALEATEP